MAASDQVEYICSECSTPHPVKNYKHHLVSATVTMEAGK
jgi:DNA-directed RNA polymerase subunit RPC12/RpoP